MALECIENSEDQYFDVCSSFSTSTTAISFVTFTKFRSTPLQSHSPIVQSQHLNLKRFEWPKSFIRGCAADEVMCVDVEHFLSFGEIDTL